MGAFKGAMRCIAAGLFFFLAACAGKQRQSGGTASHKAIDATVEEARRTTELEKKYGAWDSPRLKGYLEEVASRMRGGGVKVVLLDSSEPVLRSGPLQSLYVSRGALGAVRFENELAFLLGRAVAALSVKGPSAALDKAAVRLAYDATYDPRGAVSLLERWSRDGSVAPASEDATTFPDRLRAVRLEIAKLSPQRDPIVSTPRFEEARALISKKGGRNAPGSAVN